MKELLKLTNDDYQTRGASYPKSLIPDSIAVEVKDDNVTIVFDFKNTSDSEALEWYEKSKECKVINKFKKDYDIAVSTSQDGDFEDDWQKLTVLLSKKDTSIVVAQEPKTKNPPQTTNSQTNAKSDDTGYVYCYILSTLEQRKAIDLTKHKTKLEKIIKEFFGDRLISVLFDQESYTLNLNESFEVAEKRRLGRLISEGSDLKQYVRKVIYNGNQDTSGQLFRLSPMKETKK
ncbi:hypothetical protein SMGD1_2064 [Sulfurimonas gotlandica GD1]|uniref:Uncharacterized protein n=1 Tax=Sulfurimonas gotlandica (strain DSM 19862 / JCM 16533 / GD1) TaxID=929558 RepID=H1FX91_SULGG|nr:hypothetical protein [Sulfurimonas gotlandica]EHP30587.1 hypothetical protein SMGD1_2064 [Sulfurimonas gotlandica GD1]